LRKEVDKIEDESYDTKEKKEKLEREIGALLALEDKNPTDKAKLDAQIYSLKVKFAELSNNESVLDRKKTGLQSEIEGLTARHEEVLDSVNRLSKELSESIEANKRKDQVINEEKIQRLQAEFEVQTISDEMSKLQSVLDKEMSTRKALEQQIEELKSKATTGAAMVALQTQKTQLDSSIQEKTEEERDIAGSKGGCRNEKQESYGGYTKKITITNITNQRRVGNCSGNFHNCRKTRVTFKNFRH